MTKPRAIGFADALFLGRCRKCKVRRRIHAPVLEVKMLNRGYGRTERVYWRTVNGSRTQGYDRIFVGCMCGAQVEYRMLRGTFSTTEQCGSRCMGATGPACSCSCGGTNHGARFG